MGIVKQGKAAWQMTVDAEKYTHLHKVRKNGRWLLGDLFRVFLCHKPTQRQELRVDIWVHEHFWLH